ncbi:hypothetical protein [Plantactinospora sp. CA-290183]|uniref:hypothetical protein n=1 Tax=Plantactinospora sp. CA-290183 TaxID=3240006 RepID=UPI003D8B9F98
MPNDQPLWPPFAEDEEYTVSLRSKLVRTVERPPVVREQDEKDTTSSPELLPGYRDKER